MSDYNEQSTPIISSIKDLEQTVQAFIEELNTQVIKSSMVHYPEGQYELVMSTLIKPNEAPNVNKIYKLYSDGTITMEKGGDAYGQRSMFESEHAIECAYKYPFKFSNKFFAGDGSSYVILERDECEKFREQMKKLILLFENSK